MTVNAIMTEVNSSNLKSIGFNADTNELYVRMLRNDATYRYSNVPVEVFGRFQDAESKGSFFVREIKDQFETEKLDG